MDDLIKKVADKVGISTEQAKDAVETVMDFVKDKFPDIGEKLKGFAAGLDKDGDGLDMGDVKGAVTGMFGKKEDEDS